MVLTTCEKHPLPRLQLDSAPIALCPRSPLEYEKDLIEPGRMRSHFAAGIQVKRVHANVAMAFSQPETRSTAALEITNRHGGQSAEIENDHTHLIQD